MTVATWVCWSMTSLTQMAYGSRLRRQGNVRPCRRNHASNRRRNHRRIEGGTSTGVGSAARAATVLFEDRLGSRGGVALLLLGFRVLFVGGGGGGLGVERGLAVGGGDVRRPGDFHHGRALGHVLVGAGGRVR